MYSRCFYNVQGKMVCIEPYTAAPKAGAPFTVGAPLQKQEMDDQTNVCTQRCGAGSIRYIGRLDDNKMCLCTPYAEDTSPLPKGATIYEVCKQRCEKHNMVNIANPPDNGAEGLLCECSFDKSMASAAPTGDDAPPIRKREDCVKQEVNCDTKAYVTYFDPRKRICESKCSAELGKPSRFAKSGRSDHVFHLPGNHTFHCRAMSGPNMTGALNPVTSTAAFRVPLDKNTNNNCSEWTVTKNKRV
jgi:hypothetical protein